MITNMKILMEWIFFSFFMHYKRIWEKKSLKKKIVSYRILNNLMIYPVSFYLKF